MRAINSHDLGKAIAFMVTVLFLISCGGSDNPDEPQILDKATLSLKQVEAVSYTSATLVAELIPNQDNTMVSFEYRANSNWQSKTLPTKYSGKEQIRITCDLINLEPNTTYDVRVKAVNFAGEVTSTNGSFTTIGFSKPVAVIKPAQDIKLTEATLIASIIPNEDNTIISFEYSLKDKADSWVSNQLPTKYSGKDSIKITFNLGNLSPNTDYNFRLRAANVAGEVVSAIANFKTYAVSDYDGNLYHLVTIGNQTWLQENLKTTHFANGDPIPNVADQAQWSKLTTPAYCYYDNDPKNGEIYGALYNWYVASAHELIKGMRVPDMKDWTIIYNYLGGDYSTYYYAGPKMMETGNAHWAAPTAQVATNSSGFSALPNGDISPDKNSGNWIFMDIKTEASWWASSDFGSYGDCIFISASKCWLEMGSLFKDSKNFGLGIRLIK